MEDKVESIMDAINVTDDAFSNASISQREKEDAIFTSEKIDKSDDIVDTINSLIIKMQDMSLKSDRNGHTRRSYKQYIHSYSY